MRGSILRLTALALALFALAATPAGAQRQLLSQAAAATDLGPPPIPPPEGQIEGACGLAFGPSGDLWVSDYYHQVVDRFKREGAGFAYASQLSTEGPPQGPCGLAADSGGALYANVWHQSVVALAPLAFTIDTQNPTGVAVDEEDNLYVNARTYVAKYEAPVGPGATPSQIIGLGALSDGYGLAAFEGRLYVPDAKTKRVEVFEPSVDPLNPAFSISHNFKSLIDASVAVDPTNGHLLVVDNTQPGFVHPKAAVYEFDAKGAFLGMLPGAPVHGGPSGIAVDPSSGDLYVTDGNDELSNVYRYSPYSPGPPGPPPGEEAAPGPLVPEGAGVSPMGGEEGQGLAPSQGAVAPAVAVSEATAVKKRPRRKHRRAGRHPGRARGGHSGATSVE
jgi:DNA-binding beta-propeller fold protein YncE